MQKKIFKKLKTLLVWFCVWTLSVVALLGVNLSHAKADTLPTVEFQMPINGSGLESVATYQIPIALFGEATTSDITVDCTIDPVNTTASSGDYIIPSEAIINTGETVGYLPLQIIDNNLVNGPKTVAIQLTGISANAQLSVNNTEFTYTILDDDLLTTLTTTPKLPNGQNDWFVDNVPQVTLSSNDSNAITYYQWSTTDSATGFWKAYNPPILVSEGDKWLCYRSEDVSVSEIENTRCQEIKVDISVPVMGDVSAILTADNQVQLSWDSVSDTDYYNVYRGASFLAKVTANNYLDSSVLQGQTYAYHIVAVDSAGNESSPITASIFVPAPTIVTVTTEKTTPPVIQPAISTGVSTYKPSTVTPEVKAAETPSITNPSANNDETQEESSGSNWNKLLLAIAILIIAAAAAVGGYYGYQWWMIKKDDDDKPKENKTSSKSRW